MNKIDAIVFLKKLAEGNYGEADYNLFQEFLSQCSTADYAEILDNWEQCLENEENQRRLRVVRFGFKRAVAVAATIMAIISVGYFVASRHLTKVTDRMDNIEQATTILPANDEAVLTLADGTEVPLSQASTGKLFQLGAIKVVKTAEGVLSYHVLDDETAANSELSYHMITTSRGGRMQIYLPDGTAVWLNASSSLRFPTQFNGDQRLVELTGEGYFEVVSNPAKSFVVKTGNQLVTVLGTHFNINAYDDEPATVTTVLEGSVRVALSTASHGPEASAILKKGQQAQSMAGSNGILVADVRETTSIAWKDGRFQFNNTPIDEVMRQFSRWYDADFEYAGEQSTIKLWGNINRNVSAADALEIINFFDLEYRIDSEGDKRKIIVFNKTTN